jgi:hypothetical protein
MPAIFKALDLDKDLAAIARYPNTFLGEIGRVTGFPDYAPQITVTESCNRPNICFSIRLQSKVSKIRGIVRSAGLV